MIGLHMMRALPTSYPSSLKAIFPYHHASIVLAAVLTDEFLNFVTKTNGQPSSHSSSRPEPPLHAKQMSTQSTHTLQPNQHTHQPNESSQPPQSIQPRHTLRMSSIIGRALASGVSLMIGVLVAAGVSKGEIRSAILPAVKGGFFGAFTYVCEQIVKSVL